MDLDPMEMVQNEDDDEGGPSAGESRKSRLNNLVAISVAILATFMGLCKVKDDNIVQAMEQAQARQLDQWSYYQARNIREEVAGSTVAILQAQSQQADAATRPVLLEKLQQFQKVADENSSKKAINKAEAEAAQQRYDALNVHDDQFDLSDAMLAIAISLMALTSLTQKKWLYWIAMIPTLVGVLMGMAGLFGWSLHSDLAARLLGT
jgi:hypothetical protein